MADNMNPGAYQFVPGQGYVPTQQPGAAGQQPQGGYNPYNPYGQQGQQQQGGYYPQQQGFANPYSQYGAQGQAGGYGAAGYGYQQYQGAAGAAGQAPYGGSAGGYQAPQARQAFQPGGQQSAGLTPGILSTNTARAPASSAPSFQPSSTPFVPPAASGPAKTMSLSIGGAKPAANAAPAKSMSISIGGAKVAGKGFAPTTTSGSEKKESAKVMTIGGRPKTAPVPTPAPETTASSSEPADWDEESAPAPSKAAAPSTPSAPTDKEAVPTALAAIPEDKPATTETPSSGNGAAAANGGAASGIKVSTGKSNWTRQAAKTDSDAIAKEAARVADAEMLQELYGGEEVDPSIKSHLNVVFIGHVDAGKSTIGGQLLFLCDMVDKRTMEKLKAEAIAAGRETWYLSWALDSTPKERAEGKTVEVGRAYFETPVRRYTILDAPGHKTYVPSMINGAAQADIAILVISARKGEFETGFERGGQTREHAMLVKNNGVNKLIVVVNKMDDPTVGWAQERFEEITGKITPYLKSVGFNPKTDLTFIPVSAYTGQNMKDRVDAKLAPWHTGPSLLEYLDNMPINDRKMNAPFMLPVSEKYNEMGTMVVGKIETGRVKKGDTLLLMPNKTPVEVQGVFDEQAEELGQALCGDNVRIRLRGISDEDVSPGFVLTSAVRPIQASSHFEAQLAIVESKNIICAGYSCVLHLHTVSEEVTITALLHYYDKKTGRKSKKPPQFAKKGMRVVAVIETSLPICVEKYSDYPMLGRFTLRDEGRTIAIGKVTKIKEGPIASDLPAIGELSVTDTAATA